MEIFEYIKPSRLQRQKRRDKRLSEEVIECRRGNGGDKNKKLRNRGYTKRLDKDFKSNAPRYRSSIKDNRDDTYFNDNLEPLVRFLQSNCGKPWDQVYSKLSKQLDRRSTQSIHVLDHLWDFVILKASFVNDKLIFTNRRGFQFPASRNKHRHRFYVHPKTGILTDYYNLKQNGPYPKKAMRKKRKPYIRFSYKSEILHFKQIKTNQNKLVRSQVYDLKVTKLTGEKKTGHFRVRMRRISKPHEDLSLSVTIIKSDDLEKGQSLVLENNYIRPVSRNVYHAHEKYDWEIYDPGYFFFKPVKNKATSNYQY